MRSFIRHPTDIPVRLRCSDAEPDELPLRNISFGGVCCMSDKPYKAGTSLTLTIRHVDPPFECPVRVVWCRPRSSGQFELGLEFLSEQDAYAARMVEQVCHIEHYRKQVAVNEGRMLTPEQAAAEWIRKYAGTFAPDNQPESSQTCQ
ncbi:PilZ domain-containing protein [Hahella sp. SMD15-11]|uniref:PilZ domain-containing protein n=1 Tax=Thermohahella caldifontis TaxID=3142973 RepID=A0AB39V060_9GAMM